MQIIDQGAEFDPTFTFRFALWRSWRSENPDKCVCWIMLNPSTAGAEEDDPTIRRCISFSEGFGYSSLIVVNLNPVRATDPKEALARWSEGRASNVLLYHNNYVKVRDAVKASDAVICAWGSHAPAHDAMLMKQLLADLDVPTFCLGWNKNGSPKHPLYLRSDTQLQHFGVRALF